MTPAYKRVLIKLSGEYLGGNGGSGFDADTIDRLATEVTKIHDLGVEVAIVVGGGNIFRGVNAYELKMERVVGDHIGMLATVINGLCLQDALERHGKKTRLMTTIPMSYFAEEYIKRRVIRHFEKGRIVIFGAGTGNPYFSTDSAAASKSAEINADLLIKCTLVDGIYDMDPKLHPEAKKLEKLTYDNVISMGLQVMDMTAITFCRDQQVKIAVIGLDEENSIIRRVCGESVGSTVSS